MIYTIKSLCQITENFSNKHFLVNRLKLSVSLKAAFPIDIPFLKPCCSVTSMLLVCRCCLNLLCIAFSNTLGKKNTLEKNIHNIITAVIQPCNQCYETEMVVLKLG
jgi:hypothetical protein